VVIKEKLDNKSDLAYKLSTLYRQEPNSNWLFFIPREWFYRSAPQGQDSSAVNQAQSQKRIAEPPSIYSDSLTMLTAKDMQAYLNYKGYLRAKVIPQRDPHHKKMHVSYYALPGKRFVMDTLTFHSSDPAVDSLLQVAKPASLYKPNAPLDLSLFEQEKQRITDYLRNNGYAEFYQTQIGDLELDTFQVSGHANVYFTVYPPFGDSLNQQFFIGDVNVYQDYSVDRSNIVSDTTIAGLRFFLSERGFIVDAASLRRAISLRPGELYNQSNFNKTNDLLSELGIFRFVRIKSTPDPLEKNTINLTIQLTPNYLLEFNASLEVNYANRTNSPTPNLFGLSLSPGILHRNFLGGAELFTSSLSAGVEMAPGKIGKDDFWNTVDLRADFDLSIPQFIDYLGLSRALARIRMGKDNSLIGKKFYRNLRQKADTHIGLGYNYLLIFNWYSYNLLNVSYGYELQPSRFERYQINHFAINYLIPDAKPDFQLRLAENGFLARSFGQQVFVSLLFRGVDYTRRSKVSLRGLSGYLNTNLEVAGIEVLGINKLYNAIANKSSSFRLRDTIEFSQYVKFELDLRFQKQQPADRVFAGRFNIGAAQPFGFTSDVPYVKQFFVGGANSMRAWAPRGLGPGGYNDTLSLDIKNNFRLFQTGDFKLEMNLEYRFPIFSWFKGAIFTDVGNIWTFERDDERRASQFRFTKKIDENFVYYPFYKQLAVAGGMGLRVDLSYFIFRFDVGMKLRYPYPDPNLPPGEVAPESAFWNDFKQLNTSDFGFNFGLGFPF